MKKIFRPFLSGGLIAACLVIFASFQENKKGRFYFSGRAQGTTWHITYYAVDSVVGRKSFDSLLAVIDNSLSLYLPHSLVSKWNGSKKGIKADQHFRAVVKKGIDVFNDTEGFFDITVFPLTNAWGFGPVKPASLPDSQAIRDILPCVDSRLLKGKGKKFIKKKACVQLDPNGIAQGYSVDLLAELLEKKGVDDYLVELGGEIRVKGRKSPSGEKMTIGIEAPGDDPMEPVINRIISLENGAVTTSGNYRRYQESNGARITHLLDPRTGYTLSNELISVTVVAPDAITADAYDNALMGMGLEKALKFVEARPELAAHFVYKRSNGEIADTVSSRFKPMLVNVGK